MLFLLLHLAGVSLALLQPPAFEAYATALHQSPWLLPAEGLLSAALLYGAAGLAAGLHLLHGAEAAHRSLGLLNPGNGRAIRTAGRAVALLLGSGFLLVALLLNGRAVGWLA